MTCSDSPLRAAPSCFQGQCAGVLSAASKGRRSFTLLFIVMFIIICDRVCVFLAKSFGVLTSLLDAAFFSEVRVKLENCCAKHTSPPKRHTQKFRHRRGRFQVGAQTVFSHPRRGLQCAEYPARGSQVRELFFLKLLPRVTTLRGVAFEVMKS